MAGSVQVGADGTPRAVGRLAVRSVQEEWLVEDGWWTRKPLRRRYFELVLEDSGGVVVFCKTPTRAAGSGSGTERRPMYTELHCHSAYSFLDGACTNRPSWPATADLGYEALALTDHDNVCTGRWSSRMPAPASAFARSSAPS